MIIRKKNYNELIKNLENEKIKNEKLEMELKQEKNNFFNFLEVKDKSDKVYENHIKELKKLVEDTTKTAQRREEELRDKLKIANGAKGGLQRTINKLEKEIVELKSNRYKVRKIRPSKATTQTMKTSTYQNSSVKSTLKEIEKVRS